MKNFLQVAVVLALVLAAGQGARAQALPSSSSNLYAEGLRMEQRGDDKGAFAAFLAAAESGYPPAQRRLGEIYDAGSPAVERDYAESIRWTQKARAGGENIPAPKSPMPWVIPGP